MNNPFGVQEGASRRLDANLAPDRARRAQQSAWADQPSVPNSSVFQKGDKLPGRGLPPERTLKEIRLDRGALLVKDLKNSRDFEQLRAFVIELAREHGNEALEALARKTLAARIDMKSLQQEARKFIETLGK